MRNFLLILLFFTNFLTLQYRSALAQNNESEIRALWITRWDYSSPNDIRQIVENAAEFRFNLLLFQVRGNGTVFYPSDIDPWAREMGGSDPGWNPLEVAIAAAHKAGMQLHAWINVLPGWRGESLPQNQKQIYNAHPDWFMADETGKPMPLNSHYVWLNPMHPKVRKYLEAIILELSETPDLDGIHFDYFRYPGPGFSYDYTSLNAFYDKYHLQPADSTILWSRFRKDALSDLLRNVYHKVKTKHPHFIFSSAVIGDYDLAKPVFLQESHNWLAEGIIDIIFPMTYTADLSMFNRWLKRQALSLHGKFICPGLMIYPDRSILKKQIEIARDYRFPGFSLFAYSSLFSNHAPGETVFFLRDSLFLRTARLPKLTGHRSQIYISQVHWFPEFPTSNDSIRIVCKITGSQNAAEFRVLGIWQDKSSQSLNRFRMQQIAKKPEYWYAPVKIPPQQPDDQYFIRIVAYNLQDSTESPVSSEPFRIVVDTPHPFFHSAGEIAPPLTLATKVAIDDQKNIWVFEPDKGVRVFTSAGEEKPFSPITSYVDEKGRFSKLVNVAGLANLSDNRIAILINLNGSAVVVTEQNRTGLLAPFCTLPQPGRNFAVNRKNQFFVLQKRGWYIANTQGILLNRFEFTGIHSPNNIAVTPDGKYVFIACRTEGKVHVWRKTGKGQFIKYTAGDNLPSGNISIGGVSCGKDGSIFLASPPSASVRILNAAMQTVDFLIGGKPAIQAPRIAVPSPDGRTVIILETGGTTPVRMHKWEKL